MFIESNPRLSKEETAIAIDLSLAEFIDFKISDVISLTRDVSRFLAGVFTRIIIYPRWREKMSRKIKRLLVFSC